MNTLKPLMIVAVLAGIGYGVYVRLNRGNNAPPPVAEGWDSAPSVQMPDQTSDAPWSQPATGEPGSPPAQMPPGAAAAAPAGGQAPPFGQQPGQPGQAPPFESPAPAAANPAPPFTPPAGGNEAPPFASGGGPADPTNLPPEGPPPAANPAAPPAASPGDYPAPPVAATPPGPNAPVNDPYADSYDAGATNPYDTPAAESTPPAAEQAPAGASPPADAGGFAVAFDAAQRQLEGGQLAEALRQLSQWYDRSELTPQQQQQLNQLLDQVAGTVVYSTRSLTEPPYEVQPGERLQDIGDKYNVPWELLAKINGIDDPASLRPGERLKVVRGPFQAVVNLEKRELTLFAAEGLYAGRFQVGIGTEHPPQEGTFPVAEKVVNPVYYGRERAIGADDADNPLGERWIGLGGGVGIHGTNNPQNIGRTDLPGSISLGERDAADVFDILSVGSQVTIRR